jgi:hypothetical protein
MNEKIKQLYNRALYEYFGDEYKNCELDIYPEDQYFAELIIQEVIEEFYDHLQSNFSSSYAKEITGWVKKHFEVK